MDGLEMVESELEEGEAPLTMDYQNFDLDEAFSYMDKKVEVVLGHYRKEFEGGFSAETLGARYGGYGSFLPTYQRSPLCSQLRASSQAQNHSILKPSHLENSSVMSGGTPVKQELVSSCVPPLPLLSTSVDSSAKVLCPTEWVSSHKTAKLPVTNFDQRNLKIRIKVGSDNSTLVKKNAEIYNNLGLDMSPSSSSEDSTPEWEGNCKDSQLREHESPSRIIKIMTSFLIPNGGLLSPLRDDLVHLVKDKKTVDSRSRLTQVRASVIMDEVASVKEVKGVLGEKIGKSGSKKWKTGDFKNEYHADSPNACLAHSDKDSDSKTLTGKKTVSDGLKFLLKPSRRNKVGDTMDSAKASEAGMDGVKDQTISSNIEKEAIRSGFFQEASGKQIAETNLVGKVQKETKVRYSLTSGVGRNDMMTVGKRSESNLFEEDFGLPKANRDSLQTMDLPNRKSEQNRTLKLDSESKLQSGMKQPFSGAEKKLKENQSSFSARKSKEKGKVNPFAVPKDQSSCGSNLSKSKGDSRLHKDLRKGKNQNDLFGRIKLEKEESRNVSLGTPGKDNEKNLKLEVHDKEYVSYTIKAEKKSGDKVQQKEDPNNAHPPIGPLPANVAPAGNLIQENWVGCDRCEKWRLLPFGRNTKDLPKKWQCSMLDWLPGMNRCNISEDETTNAVHALCQVPIPNIPSTQHVKPEINASSATLTSSESFDQNTKGRSQKAGTNIPSSARHTGSTCILNTAKKKSEDLVKRKSLLNASQSSLELKSEKTSGLVRPLKMKCKREVDEYSATPLKKALTEVMPYADEDQNPGMVLKKETEVDNKQYTETSKYTGGMRKDGSVPVIGKSDRQAQPPMKTEQHGEICTPGKKRKVKDWLSSQTNGVKEIIEADCRKEKKASALKLKVIESNACEEYSKPDKKRKVNRIVLSGNKGFLLEPKSTEKDRSLGNEDRNKRSQLEVDKQSSKKDSGKQQPYVAATSSSSMISSTCKVRFNIREVRGSPVGSVCSSPLRTPNPDNLARSLNNLPTECLVGCREQDNCIQAANNAVHEVKVLKHLRDASVSGLKSTVLFFEGALKFLQGASLIDPCNSDGARYGEMTAAELYSKAAKQCEYCALEYEKFQDMASASLAYKCMEVAYMRVIYSNDCTVSRDRDQLQLGVVAVSPAESPSSSASDVDNYQAMVGKIDRVKDAGPPQMTGNLVIAARSRSNFERLLNHVQHVNSAMEASRKSQIAFTAAKLVLEEGGNHEGVSSIRKVLDYSFHDVNELLALVRFAMDALKS